MGKKVLLLNPPSPGACRYSRDYFCSKTLKGNYIEHPVDLLFLSGILYERFDLQLIDATVMVLNYDECLRRVLTAAPDAVIFISGSVSMRVDFPFLKKIKEQLSSVKMIGSGDIFFDLESFAANPWIDAVLSDFTSCDILHYLEGDCSVVTGMAFRSGGKIVDKRQAPPARDDNFSVPLPRHELFIHMPYTFPFARRLPFATLLTDYGCPFHCLFCVYGRLGHKCRALENVFAELELISSLGIREIFVKDQTFGADRQRAVRLCDEMVKRRWNFSWTAFCRANAVSEELLGAMKAAGCHTVIFGVETADDAFLEKYKCGLTVLEIVRAFTMARSAGLRTAGTFMLGFPGEDLAQARATIDFAIKLQCDFAAFNIFVDKPRDKSHNVEYYDQSGIEGVSGNGVLSEIEMRRLLREANRRFYFRPAYIAKRLSGVKTGYEAKMLILNMLGIIKRFGL